MKKTYNVADLDCVFISYDEPKKEEFWADLLNKVPYAKRVDGVKGFDNAHKAAARLSETERFVQVDGDNIVDENFFNQTITVDDSNFNTVFRYRGYNHINGLIYGNGGVVIWPTQTVLEMKTHENADAEHAQVEFWGVPHEPKMGIYSTTYPNQSPFHTVRAGLREGIKMSLHQGTKIDKKDFIKNIARSNLNKLQIWCSIGADVEWGLLALLGARYGCYQTVLGDWDYNIINNYTDLKEFCEKELLQKFDTEQKQWDEIRRLGEALNHHLNLGICEMDANASKFFKQHYKMIQQFNLDASEREVIRKHTV